MAKAFECDLCKELILDAKTDDVFYPKRIRVNIKYSGPVRGEPKDFCLKCRVELLKDIIKGIEAKQKYTWDDLKDVAKLTEVL